MRYLLMLIILIGGTGFANAQTTGAGKTGGNKKTQTTRQTKAAQQRGSGQYHGSRDTTPGSPMGTGGAGGDMSGSPAGSAIATDDQTSKAEVTRDSSAETADTVVKKSAIRKYKSVRRTIKQRQ